MMAARLAVATLCIALSGCMSLMGRIASKNKFGAAFGGPPYVGVRIDLHVLKQDEPDADDLITIPASIVDLPFSFTVDTLALPIDLVAWAMGKRVEVPFVFNDPHQPKRPPSE